MRIWHHGSPALQNWNLKITVRLAKCIKQIPMFVFFVFLTGFCLQLWLHAAHFYSIPIVLSGRCERHHYSPVIDSCARTGNSAGGSTLWGGCHWYPLCNFLLAGGWWLWLNLGFSPCHQHYCVGIPRVPALRILCHILSCQLWALPAGPVAWHNADYVSPTRAPAYAISQSCTLFHSSPYSRPPSATI